MKGVRIMRKYNLSKIMKRAWELVKKAGMTISEGLKRAWKEAKEMKEQLIEKLNEIVAEENSHDNGYHYEAMVKEWENYGKSRTYFSVIETRDNSKHYKKISYGYFDNIAEKYVAEKYATLA